MLGIDDLNSSSLYLRHREAVGPGGRVSTTLNRSSRSLDGNVLFPAVMISRNAVAMNFKNSPVLGGRIRRLSDVDEASCNACCARLLDDIAHERQNETRAQQSQTNQLLKPRHSAPVARQARRDQVAQRVNTTKINPIPIERAVADACSCQTPA